MSARTGLRSATIERMTATADSNADSRVPADLVSTFTIEIADRTGHRWEYGTGPLCVMFANGSAELTTHFDFLARDKFGELLDDVHADGFHGARPEDGFAIDWTVSDAASKSWRTA
jgi:hypothetical protein